MGVIRGCGTVGESVSLEVGIEVSEAQTRLTVFFRLLVDADKKLSYFCSHVCLSVAMLSSMLIMVQTSDIVHKPQLNDV